ncbi:MAG: SDR family oxidoreductase [Planctomycetes bacterium]|nr:SDR family oxidoreductase [Planctomycetota bacterium]MBL7043751.1 SDR family oxidoreductase [Pirellulaceae bacterium]
MSPERKLRTFEESTSIVTGGASGIGLALGKALAARGSQVVLADRQLDLAEEAADRLRNEGARVTAVELDVRDLAAFERLVQQAVDGHGRLDYLFNNAGIGIAGNVQLHEIADWYEMLDVNLRGVIHGVQAAYPIMVSQGFGHIVNTASMAGLLPTPGCVGYAAIKHAVVGLSESLRIEGAAAAVRVSVLCPGVIRTPILEDGGRYGRLLRPMPVEFQRRMWKRLRPMDVDRFAEKAIRAVAKNKPIIVIPWRWKLLWWFHRLSPSLLLRLGRWRFECLTRELERLERAESS